VRGRGKVAKVKPLKTLMLWNTFDSETCFFAIVGDLRKFHEVFINSSDTDDELVEELNALIFDDDGKYLHDVLKEPTKDWSFFVHSGFIP
jgi:hypothetical protein